MRISLSCIGRMKAGADQEVLGRYLDRAQKAGRSVGITQVDLTEMAESRAQRSDIRKSEEATQILQALPAGAKLVVLDEKGRDLTSVGFSQKLEDWKNQGASNIVFAIGGPDGHGSEVLARADLKLAFGSMTWPHQIARILLAEQIYRAITIQSGHPYHRV